jgi:hypothetical protein
VQRVLEGGLDGQRDLPGGPGADLVVVHLADRDELGRGAREVDLVGEVELGAGDVALDELEARGRGRSGSPTGG